MIGCPLSDVAIFIPIVTMHTILPGNRGTPSETARKVVRQRFVLSSSLYADPKHLAPTIHTLYVQQQKSHFASSKQKHGFCLDIKQSSDRHSSIPTPTIVNSVCIRIHTRRPPPEQQQQERNNGGIIQDTSTAGNTPIVIRRRAYRRPYW